MTDDFGDKFADSLFTNIDATISLNRWLSSYDCNSMHDSIKECIKKAENIFKVDQREMKPFEQKYSVYFSPGESSISETNKSQIIDQLRGIKPTSIKLEAFTDRDTSVTQSNSLLAKKRNNSVVELLRDSLTFDVDVLSISPDEGDEDNLDKQMHRRVDISFMFYEAEKRYVAPPRK